MRHRRARLLAGWGIMTAAAVVASVLPGSTATAGVNTDVLTVQIRYPDGTPAAGAAVALLVGAITEAPTTVAQAVADAEGWINVTVPATDELVERIRHEGGQTRAVLESSAYQAVETGAGIVDGASTYYDEAIGHYKAVESVVLSLAPDTGSIMVPEVDPQNLLPIPEFDRTFVEQLGLLTLDKVGTLVGEGNATVAAGKAALDAEMAERGWLSENEAVAYNINTANGMETWITYAADKTVVIPGRGEDADVYQVLPLTTMGLPAVDTTDAGDAVDDLTAPLGTQDAKKKRGGWERHSMKCFYVAGPADSPRYHRTVCWKLDHQVMDTTKGRSYWQYHMDASGSALKGNKMEKMWVQSEPVRNGAAAPDHDGISRPSVTHSGTQGCETRALSVYVESGAPVTVGASYTWSMEKCETYGPKMFDQPGQHASIWWGNDSVPADHYREVVLKTPISTQTGQGTPVWSPWSGQHVRH